MKLSRTNGRGLDLFQQLIRDQFGRRSGCPDQRNRDPSTGAGVRQDARRSRHLPDADKPGDSGGEATPVPIPNTEVKLSSAEDTERAAFRENRSSPGWLHLTDVVPPAPVLAWTALWNAGSDEVGGRAV